MKNLELKDIQSVYAKLKQSAKLEFDNRNYEQSLKYIETCAEIAYMFNWIYSDEDLENLLTSISEAVLPKDNSFSPIKGKVVFYDVFALDNRGLTQQYIRALKSLDVELLFIFEGNNLSHSKKIVDEISSYSKADFFVVDHNLTRVDKMIAISNKVASFRPEKAFLHLYPSSAVAVSVWNSLSSVIRYQVNLTDHAFWLGTKSINYSLEFRNYGKTVSLEKRGLLPSQLLFQPFYPITDCKPFIGFPSQVKEDSIKIFTGGAFYKMYGKSGLFFELIKILLAIDTKVVLLIAGGGDVKPLNDFIVTHNFEDRIFLLGSRSDITHVFENSDIYLSTYPLTGGLMGQYAAVCSKPILSFTTSDIPCNFIEGFVGWNITDNFNITHTNLESFEAYAKRLILDIPYRFNEGNNNAKHIISPDEFSKNLAKIFSNNVAESSFLKEEIDYDVFTNYYLDCENNYLKQFNYLMVSRLKLKAFKFYPRAFCSFRLYKDIYHLLRNK